MCVYPLCAGHAFTKGLDEPWGYALTPAYTDEIEVGVRLACVGILLP